MKMPTSSATMTRTNGNARSGATLDTTSTDPAPSKRAAAARNARLNSSSLLSEGFFGMAEGIGRKKERRGGAAAPRGGEGRRSLRPPPALAGCFGALGGGPAAPAGARRPPALDYTAHST